MLPRGRVSAPAPPPSPALPPVVREAGAESPSRTRLMGISISRSSAPIRRLFEATTTPTSVTGRTRALAFAASCCWVGC